MKQLYAFKRKARWLSMTITVVAGVFFVTMVVNAATTISTSIITGGGVYATSTAEIDGLLTLTYASSTSQSLSGNLMVGGRATTTGSSGNIATQGTLLVTGLSTLAAASSTLFSANFAEFGGIATTTFLTTGFVGVASTSPWALFSINPNGISGPAFAVGSSSATNLVVTNGGNVGVASTSPYVALGVVGTSTASLGMRIGGTGSGVTQLLFGTCSVDFPSTAASSTSVATCSAAGVGTVDRIFITPQNVPNQFVVTGASSTAANTIQISGFNLGTQGGVGAAVDPVAATYSWMALR